MEQAENNQSSGGGEGAATSPLVVGIGASAGGLEPLEQFFQRIPADSDMAFVVVQHLSPNFDSFMPELLARYATIPVHRVESGMRMLPNNVYLIPPNTDLTLDSGRLMLTTQEREGKLVRPIDLFFRSLALHSQSRCVGVVLSGTGTDGSRGIQDIADVGGLTVAQDPASAKFNGMPRAAIDTGLIDWVLPVEQIPAQLLRFAESPHEYRLLPAEQEGDPGALASILRLLRESSGIDFFGYKQSTVSRRLARRMAACKFEAVEDYAAHLEQSPAELETLLHDLLIGVTRFFRDGEGYAALSSEIEQRLFQSEWNREYRVWVAGCGTGEEAYSLAITLEDLFRSQGMEPNYRVFATDVHRGALQTASAGRYAVDHVEPSTLRRLTPYVVEDEAGYVAFNADVRKRIVFAPHNLISDAPYSRMDLVTCRNVLIYFAPKVQKRVLASLHFALNPQGLLWIGPSESLSDLAPAFRAVDMGWNVYSKQQVALFGDGNVSNLRQTPMVGYAPMERRAEFSLLPLYDRVLECYIPTGFLVDGKYQVVHSFGEAKAFVQPRSGRPSLVLSDMVRDELSLPIQSALSRASRTGDPVRLEQVSYRDGDEERYLDIEVRPHELGQNRAAYFVGLTTTRPAESKPVEVMAFQAHKASTEQIGALEAELKQTREHLQSVIEELETSNEELQSTNEELVSSNEELQSTNEELHSVNEELYTVNAEYQQKIEELTQLNYDMDNLMAATDIGTVFVGPDLQIRRFTPAIKACFNIRQSDLARPLSDISHNIVGEDLIGNVNAVIETRAEVSRHVKAQNGQVFLMRIQPYEAGSDSSGGAVVTFVDVTKYHEVEVALRESEARFRRLADSTPGLIWMAEPDGRRTYFNKSWLELTGRTQEQDLEWGWVDNVHPEDRDEVLETYRSAFKAREGFQLKYRLRARDGSYRTMVGHGVPRMGADGSHAGYVGTSLDLTEREMDRAELKRVNDEMQIILDHIPSMIWYKDANNRILRVNKAAADSLNLTPEELVNTRAEDLFPEADAQAYLADDREVIQSQEPKRGIVERFVSSEGARLIETTKVPVADADGEARSLIAIATDISDLHDHSRAHRIKEEHFRHLTNQVRDVFWVTDAACERIEYVSPGFERTWGMPATELFAYPERWFDSIVEADRESVRRAFQSTVDNGSMRAEYRIQRHDGTRRWIQAEGYPVLDDDGAPIRLVGVASDVTSSKESEEQLRLYAEKLESQNEDLAQFAQVASHDLQEPSRKMIAFSDRLARHLKADAKDDALRDADVISRAARRMRTLVQDLLMLSRAGWDEIKLERTPLDDCVLQALDQLSEEIERSGAEIESADLPEWPVDRTLIAQLYQNLISNAIKFADPERPALIELTSEVREGRRIFGVRDNGIGIDPQYVDEIFAPFKRLHARSQIDGTGVGLAICRRIVERHGGAIWVESAEDRGAHFLFTLDHEPPQATTGAQVTRARRNLTT